MQKKILSLLAVVCLMGSMVSSEAAAQEDTETRRLAQTGMKFLSITVSPRAAAMASAMTAQEMGPTSVFYNPAGMARMSSTGAVSLARSQWVSDVQYSTGAVAFRPFNGSYGTIGAMVRSANYGEFFETIRADNEQGYRNVGSYSPSSLALGVGYARALTDRFSVGGNVKYVRQSLGASTMSVDNGDPVRQENTASTVAYDLGVLYRSGFRSVNFAVAIRNFSREVTYVEENFELPLTFRIGLSMDVLEFAQMGSDNHSLLMSVDAERPRDYSQQIKVGGEYSFNNVLFLRAGYVAPTDFQGVNVGGGINLSFAGIGFSADYAYTQYELIGDVNRVGIQFSF